MIGTDEWLPSDDAFSLFLATVCDKDLSEWEARAYWKAVDAACEAERLARLANLKAS